MTNFTLAQSTLDSLKGAEMAKSDASQKGVSALLFLAIDVSDARFAHGDAAKLATELKTQAGFKAAVAKLKKKKAAAIVGFAHDAALLIVKGMPKSAEKTALYGESVLSAISALGTLKSISAVMAKVRPPKAADAPAADAPAADVPAADVPAADVPAAGVDLSRLQMFFDLLAVFARGFLQAHELNEIAAMEKAGQLPRKAKKTA